MSVRFLSVVIFILFLFITGVSSSETGTPEEGERQAGGADSGDVQASSNLPQDSSPASSAGQEGMIRFQGLQAPIPDEWVREEPANRLRLVQIQVPAADSSEAGELVVYYFGPSLGKVDDHIARWKSQFSGPDGAPVEPVITELRIQDMPVTLVEFQGDYARNLGMGPSKTVRKDQKMIVAIIDGGDGLVFVQLHGSVATVRENRAGFDALIEGIEKSGTT